MFQIRRGIFETNSSSSHSITIDVTNKLTDKPSGQFIGNFPTLKNNPSSGVLEMHGGDFGWGVETYREFNMKFQYLITHIFGHCDTRTDVKHLMQTSSQFKMLQRTITEHCSLEIVPPEKSEFDNDSFLGPVGYIDHQSVGTASRAFISKFDLENYLFNPRSVLWIDNDNH